jgi:hypothetical protein
LPHLTAIVSQDRRQGRDGFFLAADYFAGDAVLDDLGDRTASEREPLVIESALAKSVTSWPSLTSSSVK